MEPVVRIKFFLYSTGVVLSVLAALTYVAMTL